MIASGARPLPQSMGRFADGGQDKTPESARDVMVECCVDVYESAISVSTSVTMTAVRRKRRKLSSSALP